MRAVVVREPGGPDALTLADVPDPVPGPDQVVVDVAAAGVNRADLVQREGRYPPPPGAPTWPGLECAGTVSAVGDDVAGGEWPRVGDEVCALLDGGGYAEQVGVAAGQVMPLPAGVSLREAAALPEVACTVFSNVFMTAALRPGELLLVHGGGSGVGTLAIQLARSAGARVAVTARGEAKLAACRALGADVLVDYPREDFVEVVREATGGAGADVVLDPVGGAYLSRNLDVLATNGRLVVIGLMGGRAAELDLGRLMAKRAAIVGTTLRARPAVEKAAICRAVVEHVWPRVADGAVRPVVHATLPLAEAAEAHRILERSDHVGKVLLVP